MTALAATAAKPTTRQVDRLRSIIKVSEGGTECTDVQGSASTCSRRARTSTTTVCPVPSTWTRPEARRRPPSGSSSTVPTTRTSRSTVRSPASSAVTALNERRPSGPSNQHEQRARPGPGRALLFGHCLGERAEVELDHLGVVGQVACRCRCRRCGPGRARSRGRRSAGSGAAFCSTMTTETPARLIRRVCTKTSSCMTGESPADGSSRSSTDGSIISARPMATNCRSPPDSEPARWLRRSMQRREQVADELEALVERLGPLEDAHLEVLLDGQRREHVVGLRHEADARGDQRGRRAGW